MKAKGVYSVITNFFLPSSYFHITSYHMHAKFYSQAGARPLAKSQQKSGFSLIELLAVITIMAILLSIGAVGIKNVGQAQGTTAGAAVAEALMEEARTIAVSKATTARLVINKTPNEDLSDTSYLREMYVVYREVDPVTREQLTDKWIRASRATLLPEKVYFDQDSSQQGVGDVGASGTTGEIPSENHILDGGKPANVEAYYYEFNSEGICQVPGASFVCIEGAMVDGTLQGDKENQAGFVVWRNGRTSVIRDANSM